MLLNIRKNTSTDRIGSELNLQHIDYTLKMVSCASLFRSLNLHPKHKTLQQIISHTVIQHFLHDVMCLIPSTIMTAHKVLLFRSSTCHFHSDQSLFFLLNSLISLDKLIPDQEHQCLWLMNLYLPKCNRMPNFQPHNLQHQLDCWKIEILVHHG